MLRSIATVSLGGTLLEKLQAIAPVVSQAEESEVETAPSA